MQLPIPHYSVTARSTTYRRLHVRVICLVRTATPTPPQPPPQSLRRKSLSLALSLSRRLTSAFRRRVGPTIQPPTPSHTTTPRLYSSCVFVIILLIFGSCHPSHSFNLVVFGICLECCALLRSLWVSRKCVRVCGARPVWGLSHRGGEREEIRPNRTSC